MRNEKIVTLRRFALALVLMGGIALMTACHTWSPCDSPATKKDAIMAGDKHPVKRYFTNRWYDFRDLFHLAVGCSAENSQTGIIPYSFGAYAELTDFIQLGAITHKGKTAELDFRGSGVYLEDRTRFGFLMWQALRINQDYLTPNYVNYFKNSCTLWSTWMEDPVNCWKWADAPSKDLTYDTWREDLQYGMCLFPRGWQYWGYSGIELAISDPLLTHMGFTVRAGFDISELSDFILGWFCYDYKHDDLTPAMYAELTHALPPCQQVTVDTAASE